MRSTILATSLLVLATPLWADAEKFTVDPSHAQVIFSYDHFGYSTTYGMFSGFGGEIMFDESDPSASSVSVSMPVKSMFTGWEQRDGHFMSAEFFNAGDEDLITFTSTAIEVTGETTAKITGDLSMNNITKSVVLQTVLNKSDMHPLANKPFLGFDASTTILRSDFGVGAFAPAVSDAVEVKISLEAGKAD